MNFGSWRVPQLLWFKKDVRVRNNRLQRWLRKNETFYQRQQWSQERGKKPIKDEGVDWFGGLQPTTKGRKGNQTRLCCQERKQQESQKCTKTTTSLYSSQTLDLNIGHCCSFPVTGTLCCCSVSLTTDCSLHDHIQVVIIVTMATVTLTK